MSQGTDNHAPARGNAHDSGLRLVFVSSVILVLTLLFFVFLIHTTMHVAEEYQATTDAMEDYISWENAGQRVRRGSDYLTEQVRLFVQTLDKDYADRYFEELDSTQSREKALEKLAGEHVRAGDHNCIHTGVDLSNALTFREIYAIRLAAEGAHLDLSEFPAKVREARLNADDRYLSPADKVRHARELVYDRKYREAKQEIFNAVTHFQEEVLARAHEAQEKSTAELGMVLARQRLSLVGLGLLGVLTFAMVILLVIRPLRLFDRCIREGRPLAPAGAREFRELAGTYNEMFALQQQQDRMLRHKAEHDPLTDLLNRSAFDGLRSLFNSEGHPVGLILIDVDRFKEVNDTHGHETGDAALRRVAGLLRTAFRADDFCIRLGGDEFAVIISDRAPGIERVIADKIAAINDILGQPEDGVPALSISVGVAFSRQGFPDSLYGDADSALYHVKESGRRGCAFFDAMSARAAQSARSQRLREPAGDTPERQARRRD
ncbi:MAG: GGDEF domain-containing protein [Desulfovibrio sp.]|uniref:GGDEF domain-containing protein n=1 Tax=Desulfovibrio sp. TaxID=885 RepID=UPI001A6CA3B6|nr:GGDEF domain-containing protein [Desulfovibrio sp.]MBD5417289.1 GGDEF domain-containing protein [Desulfovibrio sp.]